MASYKAIVNPFTGNLTLIRADSAFHVKDSVATYNDLPVSGNTENDTRITRDTDKMYTWGIASASGSLSDWKEIGSATSVDWSAIDGKPSSTPAEIDSAVGAEHTQGTDQKLDDGGANEVTVANVKDAVDKKHIQNSDTKLDEGGASEVTASNIKIQVDAESGIEVIIGDGDNVISTGVAIAIEVPHDMTLTSVRLFAIDGNSGSIKIDIWKDSYTNFPPTDADTITGANEPEISSGTKDEDITLTDWTKSLSKGDILYFNVDSADVLTKVLVSLKGIKA